MSFQFRYSIIAVIVLSLVFGLAPIFNINSDGITAEIQSNIAYAQQETTYEFMQPLGLPGFGGDDGQITISQSSFAEYVNTLIQVAVGFAILLSVIMVIAGGAEYMGARSVTNKDDAKDRISKAIGGLVLALSAVAILQTINPNLVELNALEEVNVDSEELTTPSDELSGLVTYNPQDTGLYYCYNHDSLGANDYACAESQEDCSEAQSIDEDSYGECREVLYYNGAYEDENIADAEACFGTESSTSDPSQPAQYGVQCYSSVSECESERGRYENISEFPDPGTECKGPSNFEEFDQSGTVIPDQHLNSYVINGSPSEQEVREQLSNASPTIYTNHGGNPDPTQGNWCESVEETGCTNLGGTPQSTIDSLEEFNQEFANSDQCGSSDCNITVTGGTSWWFHGDGNTNPYENGDTYHNPTGLTDSDGQDLPTGAIDIRTGSKVDSHIESIVNSENCSDGDYYLKENNPDHWHIVFDSPKCN